MKESTAVEDATAAGCGGVSLILWGSFGILEIIGLLAAFKAGAGMGLLALLIPPVAIWYGIRAVFGMG